MPLSVLPLYITSKFRREILRDNYLFDALRAFLILKPGEYYPQFPAWRDLLDKPLFARANKRGDSFDRIVDRILDKL